METGQEGFAVGLPFHVRLRPRPAACPRRGLFLRAHAAKAGEGKPKGARLLHQGRPATGGD
jgi:hypothetical protein